MGGGIHKERDSVFEVTYLHGAKCVHDGTGLSVAASLALDAGGSR